MKIAYLCSDVDVQVFGHDGCSVHIREFTNALHRAGHDVFVICAWAGKDCDSHMDARVCELQPAGLNAAAWDLIEQEPIVADNHLDRDLRSVMWNTWLQNEGAAIIEQERPDFLYERYALFGWGGVQLSRRFGIPLIMELNAPLCQQQDGYHKFTLTQTAQAMEAHILGGAHAVVALTQWLKDWAVERGVDSDRIHVLPDGVSEELFGSEISGAAVRDQYGLDDKRVVGFVGSFHGWHDVAGLVEAFAALHEKDDDLRLLLVGGGEGRNALEKSIRKRGLESAVVFAGKVPHEQVPAHIAAMDIAVVPYKPIKDFFFSPMKLFECMAAGRPTVAAALGQIVDVIDHGKTGCLYPAGDDIALAEAIGALLNDATLAANIGEAARQLVLEQYTWSAVVKHVTDIAQSLLPSVAASPER